MTLRETTPSTGAEYGIDTDSSNVLSFERAKDASDAESDMVMHKRVGVRSLHKRRGVRNQREIKSNTYHVTHTWNRCDDKHIM